MRHPLAAVTRLPGMLTLLGVVAGCAVTVEPSASRATRNARLDAGAPAAAPATTTGPAALAGVAPASQPAAPEPSIDLDDTRLVGGLVYLVPERHEAPAASGGATVALRALLADDPVQTGSRRPFPAGTRLLGFAVRGDQAVVDLSAAALAPRPSAEQASYDLQCLVWTLTRFEGIRQVWITVHGRPLPMPPAKGARAAGTGLTQPFVRDPAARVTPVAAVEPRPHARVTGDHVVVVGEARVRAATVGLRLRDTGRKVVAQGYTTADQPAGRGRFRGARLQAARGPPALDRAGVRGGRRRVRALARLGPRHRRRVTAGPDDHRRAHDPGAGTGCER